jgi:hypothetical protein
MEPIARFPDGTSHDEALHNLGYTVIDALGEQADQQPTLNQNVAVVEQSVLSILPEPIAAMVAAAQIEETS